MRIGIITHNYPLQKKDRKDAGIFLFDFAHELSRKNKVFVLAPNFKGVKEKDKKVSTTWFKWSGGETKLGNLSFSNVKSILQFISLLINGSKAAETFTRENKLDYILAAWAFPAGLFALYAHIRTGVPYATWSLGSDINIYAQYPGVNLLIKYILRRAHKRFSNSYALIKKIDKLANRKTLFLPAVTNLQFPKINKNNTSNKSFQFLFIGRLENVKGVDILIKAARLLPTNKKWHISIGGSGTKREELELLVQQNNLSKNVSFLGAIDDKELALSMLSSDCLVIPSRSESLPLVLIEAANASLPVIAADVGDCKRMISTYKIGFSFKREDTTDLSRKMKMIMSRRKKSFTMHMDQLVHDFTQKNAVGSFIKYITPATE